MKRYTLFPIVIIFVILIVVSCTKIGFSDQSTKGEVSQLTNPSSSTSTLDEIRKLLLGKTSGEEKALTVDILFATPEFFQAFAAAQAKEQGVTEDDILKSYKDIYSFDKFLVFAVDLNTHSVDLAGVKERLFRWDLPIKYPESS